jgi:hypothetical protein
MIRITGIDPATGKRVDVATADNETERDMILKEEARNYEDLQADGMRVAGRRRLKGQE